MCVCVCVCVRTHAYMCVHVCVHMKVYMFVCISLCMCISVYRKKTHTDRYLDFTSHHPLAHKVAVARTLMTQANRIWTFVPDRVKEKQHIAEALNNNGYSSQHVNENWWARSIPRPSSSEDPPKATVVIPYIRHLAESIRRILTPLKVRTCFQPHRTLKQMLVSLKDHIP